ncbi:MAG: hypothetical protein WA761_03540 [Thermoplasmata archaeon]
MGDKDLLAVHENKNEHVAVVRYRAAALYGSELARRRDRVPCGAACLTDTEFSLNGDEMAYVFPSDAGRACVALTLNLATFRWLRVETESRFGTRLQRHQGIWDRYRQATPDGGILGCGPEPNFVRVPIGRGRALVGDAGMHQDPWTGLGMDNAGLHATFLADSIVRGLNDGESLAGALEEFHHRRDQHALEGYRETVRLAQDLRQLRVPPIS